MFCNRCGKEISIGTICDNCKSVRCDRCGKPITSQSESVRQFLDQEYIGKTICEACDAAITTVKSIEEGAMLNNETPREYLKKWLKNYKIDVE